MRPASKIFYVTFMALTVVGLTTEVSAQAARGQVAAGKQLAVERCGGCHAVGMTDASRKAAPPFRSLHERYPVEQLAEALAEGIDVGKPAMPVHVLEADEVAALIAYLKTLEPTPRRKSR